MSTTYKVNLEAAKKESGSANSIYRSGVYDIKIQKAYISTTKNGAKKMNIRYRLKGSDKDNGTLFITLTNINGSENFQKSLFDKLVTVIGLTEVSTAKQSVVTKKETFEAECFPALENKEVKVWVKFRYTKYNGNISENIDIQDFFRSTDKASAREILTKADIGKRYTNCEKSFSITDYRDGLTKEDVMAWLEARKNGTQTNVKSEVKESDEIPF